MPKKKKKQTITITKEEKQCMEWLASARRFLCTILIVLGFIGSFILSIRSQYKTGCFSDGYLGIVLCTSTAILATILVGGFFMIFTLAIFGYIGEKK